MKWMLPIMLSALTACGAQPKAPAHPREVAKDVLRIGRIANPRITESSGVLVSRKDPLVFWTHNDGGGKRQVLYAMTRQGQPLGEFRITGAVLEDWEDMAGDDQGHLFLADTGNNDARRTRVAVHQIDEPDLQASQNGLARVTRSWELTFPQQPLDCEALVVWGGHGYLFSKVVDDERADLYRFALTTNQTPQTLELIGELRIDSPVTGADISADGKLLAVVAKNGAYVYRVDGDLSRVTAKVRVHQTKFRHDAIEACTFVPEGLLVTAESREIFLFTDEAFRTGPDKSDKKR